MVWGQAYGEVPSAAAHDPFAVVERDTRAMVTASWWATTPPLQRQNLTAGRMLVLPDGTWWLFGAWARWYRWLPADGQWHLCPPPRLPMTRTSARPLGQGMPVPRIPPHLVPSGPDFSQEPPQALPFVDVDVRPEVTSRVRATVESAAALPPHDYPHWWGAFSSSTPSTVAVGWGVMLWSAAAPVFYSGLDAQLLDLWSPYRARPLPDVDGPRWLTPPPLESLVGLYAERLRAHRVDAAVVILRTMWAMASALRQDARFRPRADALLAVLGTTLHNPTVDYAALPYGDQAIVQQWLTRCPPVLAPALRIEASAGEHFRNAFYDLAVALASVAGDPAEQGYVEPRLVAAALLAADLAVVRRDVAGQVIGWLDPETRRTTQAILTGPDHPLRRFWPKDNRLPLLLRRRVEKLRPSARGALLATMYAVDLAWCRLGGGIPARPRGFPAPVAILAEILGPDRARSAAPADPVTPTPGVAPLARQYPANPVPAAPPAAPPVAHQPPTGPPGQAPTWAPPPAAAAVPAGTMADVGPPQGPPPAASGAAGTMADVGPPPIARPAASSGAADADPPPASGVAGTMADVGPPPVARSGALAAGDAAASGARSGGASGTGDADPQSMSAGPAGTMADVGPLSDARSGASAGGDAASSGARSGGASGTGDADPPSASVPAGSMADVGPSQGVPPPASCSAGTMADVGPSLVAGSAASAGGMRDAASSGARSDASSGVADADPPSAEAGSAGTMADVDSAARPAVSAGRGATSSGARSGGASGTGDADPPSASVPAGSMADVDPSQAVLPAVAGSAGTMADVGPSPVAGSAASAGGDAASSDARSDVSSGAADADPPSAEAGPAGTMADVDSAARPAASAGRGATSSSARPDDASGAADADPLSPAPPATRVSAEPGTASASSATPDASGEPGAAFAPSATRARDASEEPGLASGEPGAASVPSATPDASGESGAASGQPGAAFAPLATRARDASGEPGLASGEPGLASGEPGAAPVPPATRAWDPSRESGLASGEPGAASVSPAARDASSESGPASAPPTRVAWEPGKVGEATMLDRPSGQAAPLDATYIDAPGGGTRADAGGVPIVGPPPAYSVPPMPPGPPVPSAPPMPAGAPVPLMPAGAPGPLVPPGPGNLPQGPGNVPPGAGDVPPGPGGVPLRPGDVPRPGGAYRPGDAADSSDAARPGDVAWPGPGAPGGAAPGGAAPGAPGPPRTRVLGVQEGSAEPPGTRKPQPERPGTMIMSQTMMGDLLGAPMPGRPVGDIEPPPSGTVLPEVTERFGIRFVSGEDPLAGLLDDVRRRASSGEETSPALLVVGAHHSGQRRLARLVARTLADAGVGDGSVRTVDGTDAHGDPVRILDATPVGGAPLLFEWIDAALLRASDPGAVASAVTRCRENGTALIATCEPGAYERLTADFPGSIGRFRVFRLPDLSDTETRLALVHVLADERRVTVNAPALQTVKADLPRLTGYGDLVNARLVEAYLDRAIARHTDRFGAASRDRLVLTPEDFSGVAEEIEPALRAPGDVDGFLRSLDEMIGLDEVKQIVGDLVTEARLAAERAARGLPSGNPSRHLVFLGRPGTGKRTVAGLIGGMYAALSLLDSGQVVTCSARDLAGDRVAAKVAAQVDRAVGGVLLIEDASLLDRTSAAVTALLRHMEERRDKFLVVCSSEPDEMDGFLLANPGFRAEFGAIVEFREPTDRQLVQLFSRFAERELYLLDEELRVELLGRFGEMRGSRRFAFAETVRRLFDAIVARQAARLAGARVDAATVARLTVRDLPESPAERLLQHLHEDRTRR
ncbi:hypothetical protein [Actinoallomurus vinaceus]|uniref:hypothetical protein n=1 Tax=Actinoallomurus vinaceus TaxID=1080074 RepID=UPI0031EEB07A